MFEQIKICNFKSLKALDFKCAKLNLLTGLNGSGKSSFIQALLCLKKLFSQRGDSGELSLRDESRNFGTAKDLFYSYDVGENLFLGATLSYATAKGASMGWEMKRGSDLDISLEFKRLNDYVGHIIMTQSHKAGEEAKRISYEDMIEKQRHLKLALSKQLSIVSTFKKEELPGKMQEVIKLVRLREEVEALGAEIKKFSGKGPAVTKAMMLRLPDFAQRIKYLSANRSAPHYEHTLSPDVNDPNLFGDDGDGVVSYLLSKSARKVEVIPGLRFPGNETPDILSQINAWMGIVSPGTNVSLSMNMERTKALVEIGFAQGDGDTPRYRPQNVGFGISYTLPVLALILTATPGDVLIIENPEAHLHPRGQAEIGKLLAKAAACGIQIFVETHSDHVINGIRVAVKQKVLSHEDVMIKFFKREAHDRLDYIEPVTEIYTSAYDILVDAHGSLSDYPADFMDEWNNQLLELLK